MARKARVETEGGLYYVIARGNDRQDIFHSGEDYLKFLSFLGKQKESLHFYIYAYCLMTNHVHLLIERREERVGRIMQRVLTGYSQYYNRRYRRVGHVFQGRHKAILCQSDPYLAKLIRYIHLNPVRAKMVTTAEEYPYSSQRSYLGMETAGVVDVDPVLRRFGPIKEVARKRFAEFVRAGAGLEYENEFGSAEGSLVLGSLEFVDDAIHRMGEVDQCQRRKSKKVEKNFHPDKLIAAIEIVLQIPRETFCGAGKSARSIMAKEILILTATEAGATAVELSRIIGLDSSSVSRRLDAARMNTQVDSKLDYAKALVKKEYYDKIAESHA